MTVIFTVQTYGKSRNFDNIVDAEKYGRRLARKDGTRSILLDGSCRKIATFGRDYAGRVWTDICDTTGRFL